KMQQHKTNAWLVNTGWSGGSYGVGKRMKLALTRKTIDAIHSGKLASAPTTVDPVFGFQIVTACDGVPPEVLTPRKTWAEPSAYDTTAKKLAGLFRENFKKYEADASAEIREAGPRE